MDKIWRSVRPLGKKIRGQEYPLGINGKSLQIVSHRRPVESAGIRRIFSKILGGSTWEGVLLFSPQLP
jgi:hypothetical protein